MLTSRERAVLIAAADGMSTKITALALSLSYWTVQEYRGRILRKLEARNMSHAVTRAWRSGIISAEDLAGG